MRVKEDAMGNGQLKAGDNLRHGADSEYVFIFYTAFFNIHLPLSYRIVIHTARKHQPMIIATHTPNTPIPKYFHPSAPDTARR